MVLQTLLDKTSRTFALAIPLLPQPTRKDVQVAYLIFRIADTLEDCDRLVPAARIDALQQFEQLLASPNALRAKEFTQNWATPGITGCPWHDRLLKATPTVLRELQVREERIQQCIRLHARRTALGMASFLDRDTQPLETLAALSRYCYVVAGIVGEMLTDIFIDRIRDFRGSMELRKSVIAFGEGLQLVNILKDSEDDARCGRKFLPSGVDLGTVFGLARQNLREAEFFVDQLRLADAPQGFIAFSRIPLELAWATLDHVERVGPGSKVTREQVAQILDRITGGNESNHLRTSSPSPRVVLRQGIAS